MTLAACDPGSNEIGASASGGGEQPDPSSGEQPGDNALPCSTALDAQACAAVTATASFACEWAEVYSASDTACGELSGPVGRCILTEVVPGECQYSPCIDEAPVYTQMTDKGMEWFAAEFSCEHHPVGFDQCPGFDPSVDEPGCGCACLSLGGFAIGEHCDPLDAPCDIGSYPQECEPLGDAWRCIPQSGDGELVQGDPCPTDEGPFDACQGKTVCVSTDTAPVSGCDGAGMGGCCAELCDLDTPSCTSPDETCVPYTDVDDLGTDDAFAHVGVCTTST